MQGRMWIAYILLTLIPPALGFCTTYTIKLAINTAESGMTFTAALGLMLIFVLCYCAADICTLHLTHCLDIGEYKIKSSLVKY